MPGGISIHAVDVAQGLPASGLRVQLFWHGPTGVQCLAEGRLGPGGALDHPITSGVGVRAGTCEVHFHIGQWWRERPGPGDLSPQPFFQEVAVFRFELSDLAQHYHLPMKFTPWGLTLFRGF